MIVEVVEKKRRLQSQLVAVPVAVSTAVADTCVTSVGSSTTTHHAAPAALSSNLMVAPASRSLRSSGPTTISLTAVADNAERANLRRSEVPSSSSASVLSVQHHSAAAAGLTTTTSSTSSTLGAAPTSLQHSLPEDSMRCRGNFYYIVYNTRVYDDFLKILSEPTS